MINVNELLKGVVLFQDKKITDPGGGFLGWTKPEFKPECREMVRLLNQVDADVRLGDVKPEHRRQAKWEVVARFRDDPYLLMYGHWWITNQ